MEAPPIIQPLRRRSAWWLGLVVPAAVVVAVLFFFNPSHYGFYPRCLLYRMTGILCPGCGSLRALHQLSHGNLLAAMRCNLLLVISLPFFAWYAFRWLKSWLSGSSAPQITFNAHWVVALVLVVVVFTILRNIPGAPFDYLAPGLTE